MTRIGIILSDSCCTMGRVGVTAFALATCGIDPFGSQVGTPDLYGKPLTITVEATADQLATAGNTLMGNAAQGTPAAVIRDHGMAMSEFCGWVEGIEREKDLFRDIMKA